MTDLLFLPECPKLSRFHTESSIPLNKEEIIMVKQKTKFKHSKGNIYEFLTIVHPSSEISKGLLGKNVTTLTAFHTEREEEIKIIKFIDGHTHILYTPDADEYLALYQREDSPEQLYARPVEMFFDHVGWSYHGGIKRFEEITKNE